MKWWFAWVPVFPDNTAPPSQLPSLPSLMRAFNSFGICAELGCLPCSPHPIPASASASAFLSHRTPGLSCPTAPPTCVTVPTLVSSSLLFLVVNLLLFIFSSSSSFSPLWGWADLAVPGMAAAASMASLTSTSCLPQRLFSSRAHHQTASSSRLGLGFRASAGLSNSQQLVNSSFNGIQLQVHTPASVRKQSFGVGIRAAGAKGDYLVQKVSARELDDILANERSSPMVVDFYATWCGPCILLAQELEQLAVEYGDRVRFLKIDTDEEHELANQMEIRGLPTMVFVSPDTEKLAIRTEGLLSTNVIRDIIEKEL